MLEIIWYISGGALLLAILIGLIAQICFDDSDQDQYWYDNYQVLQCPHEGEKTLVNVSSSTTCEVVHTVCDDCGKTLKVEIEC